MIREALLFAASLTAFAQANYQALKQALALTDAQTQQLQDLQKNRQEAAQAVYQKISDKQRQLNEALASPAPNPTAIGQLEIDMASLRKQIGAGPSVRDEALAILTDAQKEKLKDLQNAMQLQRAANEAIGLGLISAPPPVATPIRGIPR